MMNVPMGQCLCSFVISYTNAYVLPFHCYWLNFKLIVSIYFWPMFHSVKLSTKIKYEIGSSEFVGLGYTYLEGFC